MSIYFYCLQSEKYQFGIDSLAKQHYSFHLILQWNLIFEITIWRHSFSLLIFRLMGRCFQGFSWTVFGRNGGVEPFFDRWKDYRLTYCYWWSILCHATHIDTSWVLSHWRRTTREENGSITKQLFIRILCWTKW